MRVSVGKSQIPALERFGSGRSLGHTRQGRSRARVVQLACGCERFRMREMRKPQNARCQPFFKIALLIDRRCSDTKLRLRSSQDAGISSRDPERFSRGRTAKDVFEPGEEKSTCRANFDKLFLEVSRPKSSPTSMRALPCLIN